MISPADNGEMSFWDHLEALRWVLLRCGVVLVVLMTVLFFFKDFIFDTVILAPAKGLKLINIEVTAQFFIHVRVTFICSLVLAFPYLAFELWRFVAPGLYASEKKAVRRAFGLGSGLFYAGAAFGYFVVMPLVIFFFSRYQVSASVENTFSLGSYVSTFSAMVLIMGLLFEMPTVISVLGHLGVVTRRTLRNLRRHAVVVLLLLAAILTPTGDPFTMTVVALPLYLLYEFSILLCPKDEK